MQLYRKSTCIWRNRCGRKPVKGRKRTAWAGVMFLLPSLLGVAVFVLVPYLDVIRRSFTEAVGGGFVGLKNYQAVLGNSAFLLAAGNTGRFTVICIPVLVGLSLLLAVLLEQCPLGEILKSMYLVPLAIPVASVVLLWKLLFHQNGLVNALLSELGVGAVNWMGSGASFWVLVFSYIWKNLGYDIVLWMAGLAGIPETIYEAARVDGAGRWRCFLSITLPNLLPTLYMVTVLSFLNSFKVFREAYLVAGDYPNEKMYLLQHLFNNWFRELSLDKLSAAAVMLGLVIFGLIRMLQKAWEKE